MARSVHPMPGEMEVTDKREMLRQSSWTKETDLSEILADEDLEKEVEQLMPSHLGDDEKIVLSLRQKIWLFMDDPSSSPGAKYFSLFIAALITFSVVVFCVESLYTDQQQLNSSNQTQPLRNEPWDSIEEVNVGIFTVEYLLRLITCPNKFAFLKSPLNTIDLVAIVPFYLEAYIQINGGNSAIFRVVRLVRIFRVFKISRRLSWIKIFMEAMQQSAQPLAMLLFVIMIGCVFFSSAMFFIERGDFDEESNQYVRFKNTTCMERSPFQSIPETFYWCIITMTTVGYGDVYPVTPLGKLLAGVTSLTGILVLAIPITIISTNFNVEYEKLKKQRKFLRARVMLLKNHFKEKRSGLETMKLEIEEIVNQASLDFMKEIEELVDASKEEMALELQELVKLAYHSRQKDLIAMETQKWQDITNVHKPNNDNTEK